MHSKYWLLVSACKSLNPVRQKQGEQGQAQSLKEDLISVSSPSEAVHNIIDLISKGSRTGWNLNASTSNVISTNSSTSTIAPKTTLIDLWYSTYGFLKFGLEPTEESQDKQIRLLFQLIHFSDPEIVPIVPCFIDALSYVHQLLPPLSIADEKDYIKRLLSPPPPTSETKEELEPNPKVEPESKPVQEPESMPGRYMPSDIYQNQPPTRWSEVLRDLFAINTKVSKHSSKMKRKRRSRSID